MSTLPPVVVPKFRFRRGALEPQGIWIDDGDVLLFRSTCDPDLVIAPLTHEARVRIMSPTLKVEDYRLSELRQPAGPTEVSTSLPLTPGFLIGASAAPAEQEGAAIPGFHHSGIYYAVLAIGKGAPRPFYLHTLLAAGYVTAFSTLGWPGGQDEVLGGGPGFTRAFSIADPAAGVDVPATTPARGQWKLQALSFVLTTSAVAGNRDVHFRIDNDAGGVLFSGGCNVLQVAGQAVRYCVGHLGFTGAMNADARAISIPGDLLLLSPATIQTNTNGLLAGDQFSQIRGQVRQWSN